MTTELRITRSNDGFAHIEIEHPDYPDVGAWVTDSPISGRVTITWKKNPEELDIVGYGKNGRKTLDDVPGVEATKAFISILQKAVEIAEQLEAEKQQR